MCGIVGIVTSGTENYKDVLKKMTEAIRHRGPDGEGQFFFKECCFGHRRLSIVDIKTGHQPMYNEKYDVGITFNGEIYGYRNIKQNINGYSFKTSSDTEVLLALYIQNGEKFVESLPGMFAFAIWDNRIKQLLVARDRFGEKPLYFAYGKNNEFIFASEIKALLASGLIEPQIDLESVSHYFQYLYVHPNRTIYRNIHTLPPGHLLKFSKNELKIEKYWCLPPPNNYSFGEAVEVLSDRLMEAIKKQLIADVPVGAFLSGGLDSSTIVALASSIHPNIKTFSFGFGDRINELPYAKLVANRFSTDHYELQDSDYDIASLILKMSDVYDEPFADSSNIPTFLISQLTSSYAKVVLSGDGGDELLGGYQWYKPLFHMSKIKNENLARYWAARFLVKSFYGNVIKSNSIDKYVGQIYYHQYPTLEKAHEAQKKYFSDSEIGYLNLPILKPVIEFENTMDNILRMDIENYLCGDILVKSDRASMANGLEVRTPYLDKDVASFCIGLPFSFKIIENEDKVLLRKTFSELLPDIVLRRNKQGFGAPVSYWLKQASVARLKSELLIDPKRKIFSLLPYKNLQSWASEDSYKTWILLNFSVWFEKNG